MANKHSCISRIIFFIVVIGLISCAVLFYCGHREYQEAIADTPIQEKVEEIQKGSHYTKAYNISKDFLNAVVIVEDKRFYTHGPVDLVGIARAVVTDIKEWSFTEGGSTLTQQVAKNLYFSNEKSITRKIAEVFVARDLEERYTKDEILELYCNIIYFGEDCYNIYDASRLYFNKTPDKLSFEESAMLAGIPKAPSVYNPVNSYDKAVQRQKVVIELLGKNGITADDED